MNNPTTNSTQAEAQEARMEALRLEIQALKSQMAEGRHSIINCLCVAKGTLELVIRNLPPVGLTLTQALQVPLRAIDRTIAAVNDAFPPTGPLNCRTSEKKKK